MGPRGVALLLITFAVGAGAGVILSASNGAPSEQNEADQHRGSPVVPPVGPTLVAKAQKENSPELRQTAKPELDSTEAERLTDSLSQVGSSLADLLHELEKAYQGQALSQAEAMDSVSEGGEEEAALDEQNLALVLPEEVVEEVLEESELIIEAPVSLEVEAAARAEEEKLPLSATAELRAQPAIAETDALEDRADSELRPTVVIHNHSPVYLLGAQSYPAAVPPRARPPEEDARSNARAERLRRHGNWMQPSYSHNDPWAPIDYSEHHNPFSSTVGGRAMRSPSTSFVFRLRN